MFHTIRKMNTPDKENLYSFRDVMGNCIIIVYGDNRRDAMSKYLTEPGDELRIKHYYIDLSKKKYY